MYQIKKDKEGVVKAGNVKINPTSETLAVSFVNLIKEQILEGLANSEPADTIDRLRRSYSSARGKEVDDLSMDEKFAICFFFGAEINWNHYNEAEQSYAPTTRYPCEIKKVNDKFEVYEARV